MPWKEDGWEIRLDLDSVPKETIGVARKLTDESIALLRIFGLRQSNAKVVHIRNLRAAYCIYDIDVNDWAEDRQALRSGLLITGIDIGQDGNPCSSPSQIMLPRDFRVFHGEKDTLKWLYQLKAILPEALLKTVDDFRGSPFIGRGEWQGLLLRAAEKR